MKPIIGILTALAPVAMAATPYTLDNNSPIKVAGKVTRVEGNAFILDYGEGAITVEMDDYDWYPEHMNMLVGDDVVVRGFIDHDEGEIRSIEAGSVFVKGMNTYFYASPDDEEDVTINYVPPVPVVYPQMELRGKVLAVDGREFVLEQPTGKVVVNTAGMSYDPTDNHGYQKITPGDFVSVIGEEEKQLLSKNEIRADSIVTLKET
ncbi:MAG: hypothetical protein Q7Q71_12050 [Verrucomicrobiota bacterium JB023]|nr:hypothetical protein [Verrucomicrobiota bacterium JB023]